jgi:hypothetical protein
MDAAVKFTSMELGSLGPLFTCFSAHLHYKLDLQHELLALLCDKSNQPTNQHSLKTPTSQTPPSYHTANTHYLTRNR